MTDVKNSWHQTPEIWLPSGVPSWKLRGPSGTAGFWWVRFWCRFLAIRTVPFLIISGHVSGDVSVGASALRFHHSGGPPKTIRKTLPVSTHLGHFRALAALWPESSSESPAETDQKRSETESWKHWQNVLLASGVPSWQLRGPLGTAGFWGVRLVSIFSFRVTLLEPSRTFGNCGVFEETTGFCFLASGLPSGNLRGPLGTAVFLNKPCFWCFGDAQTVPNHISCCWSF